uniref:Uncharacterized protein n=1 Tax=mine drainage metagenome TaxID=410659 RepID=E6QWD7_9ZZZZ
MLVHSRPLEWLPRCICLLRAMKPWWWHKKVCENFSHLFFYFAELKHQSQYGYAKLTLPDSIFTGLKAGDSLAFEITF